MRMYFSVKNFRDRILSVIMTGNIEFYYWKIRTSKLRKGFKKLHVYNHLTTIKIIAAEKKSLSRFGDGEFKIMFNDGNPNFQQMTAELTKRLREVIVSNDERLIVAIPLILAHQKREKVQSKYFWLKFIGKYREQLNDCLSSDRIYGNAGVSRFYLGQNDRKHSERTAAALKTIWDDKEILIVEGSKSRLGVGTDLFDSCKTIKRIICPSKNAFEYYDEILSTIINYAQGQLVLISLGPTATVLAYDLAMAGFWALDIGHVDIEYIWMKLGAKERVPIQGRHISELHYEQDSTLPSDVKVEYEKTIVAVI